MNDEQIQEEGGMTGGGCLLGTVIGICLAFAPPLGLFLAFTWVVIHVWSKNASPRADGSMRTPKSLILLRMFGVVLAASAIFFIPFVGPAIIVLGALVAVVKGWAQPSFAGWLVGLVPVAAHFLPNPFQPLITGE